MITRPTTDVLIEDCCRELMEVILPGLTDETLRLRLVMTETVLRNAAVRAAHEVAWMREETAALLAYAGQVAARHGSAALRAALTDAEAGPTDSLHLADLAEVYERAGQAFAAFSRQLARDVAPEIRVNTVAPGRTRTGMTEPLMIARAGSVEQGMISFGQGNLQKRVAEPEEIAAPVCFLLSSEASFITGALLAVDGGETA